MDYKYYVPLYDWEMSLLTGLLQQVTESLKTTANATINPEVQKQNVLMFQQLLVRFDTVKDYYDNQESNKATENTTESEATTEDGD